MMKYKILHSETENIYLIQRRAKKLVLNVYNWPQNYVKMSGSKRIYNKKYGGIFSESKGLKCMSAY